MTNQTPSSKKDWRLYARHILDCVAKIEVIRQRGDLTQDAILYDAALRNLQTLSEATQRLPLNLKVQANHIPWAQISGFRNVLVHDYLGTLDALTVEGVITQHLPVLAQAVKAMLQDA